MAERGLFISKTTAAFHRATPAVLASQDGEITADCRDLLIDALQHLQSIEQRIDEDDARVKQLMKHSELCRRIGQIEGVGPLTATAVVAAVGDARAFKNGRHLAAWLGLVPRRRSAGGRSRLYGISKRGDAYLRTRRRQPHGSRGRSYGQTRGRTRPL